MYKRRIKIFLGLIFLVLALLAGRLGYLQIVRGEDYRFQMEKTLQRVETLPASRGQIVDRNGRILATDQACFDLCMDYGMIDGSEQWATGQMIALARSRGVSHRQEGWRDRIRPAYQQLEANSWVLVRAVAHRVGQDADAAAREIHQRLTAWQRNTGGPVREQRQAHPVVTGLDAATAAAVKDRLPRTIGLSVRPNHRRWYPYGSLACHIVGTTGPVNREDLDRHNLEPNEADRLERLRHNYEAWDHVGRSGVERMAEDLLRGRRGYRRVRLGERVLEGVAPQPGGDVHLTIDAELQQHATELLARTGHTGAAVVLSVDTCDVLAMVSVPVYDLNQYRENYNALVGNEVYLPLHHRAVVMRYPPGSTAKPITALAGLASAVIDERSVLPCAPGYIGNNPTSFRCWRYKRYHVPHDPLDVVDGLMRSCNVFFFRVANRMGTDRLVQWLALFGYGERPGTGLPEERPGQLPTPGYMRQVYRRGYRPADGWLLSIGQGPIGVTPLHVASAMATIARGGIHLTPLLALEGAPAQRRSDLPIPDEHIRAVREGMYRVVNASDGGTAYKYFHGPGVIPLDVEICGKTGTAETAPHRIDSNDNGRIDSEDRVVRTGDTGWFAGFAPRDDPKIAFAVMIEYCEGGGGANAGPVARELVRLCHQMGYLD
jgi:penicillin-binding protein 2